MRPYFVMSSPGEKFFFSIFIIISSFLVFSLLSFLIALPFYNILNLNLENLSDPEVVKIMKYLQIIQTIGLFLIPAVLLSYIFNGNLKALFNQEVKPGIYSIGLVIFIMILVIPFLNYLVELNSNFHLPSYLKSVEQWMKESEDSAARITEAFLNIRSLKGLFFNIFLIGVLPAFAEELIFRGLLQKILI